MIQPGSLQSAGTGAPYYFGSQPVYPAMAMPTANNAALGVPGGQMGGAGMAPPAGATAAPTGMGSMGTVADIVGILGDTASKYIAAGTVPTVTPELPPPTNGALQIPTRLQSNQLAAVRA